MLNTNSDRVRSAWRARRVEAGGGVVLMNVIHQVDVLRMMTGMELTDVYGYVGTMVADRAEVEVEDTGVGVFRMSNGATRPWARACGECVGACAHCSNWRYLHQRALTRSADMTGIEQN